MEAKKFNALWENVKSYKTDWNCTNRSTMHTTLQSKKLNDFIFISIGDNIVLTYDDMKLGKTKYILTSKQYCKIQTGIEYLATIKKDFKKDEIIVIS